MFGIAEFINGAICPGSIYRKQEGAYDKWRKFIDGQLESLKEYATGEAEWQRFLKGEPILPDYVRVKNVISGAQSIPQREWWD